MFDVVSGLNVYVHDYPIAHRKQNAETYNIDLVHSKVGH